ncbi:MULTISPECIES: NusG domain II-containing protein [unclassified Treponema]|uniref:NusG domain II-containing protein n=1 Tax=unclassified Treponema TaxID=2638727 RepID=UPI0020A59C94|nr:MULTISPECIES: NusG domain II-containing protein [unclassified Treponema]UTC66228.1 NusG domain II-containing protein [Treponema sp. OMZ 789]UTC68957.1 NusG domain II-containing protein [Treponema sp. OMZ 790]UTC71684.1 NusG domain II-containing protein [Treponema sp. OMZ 791]
MKKFFNKIRVLDVAILTVIAAFIISVALFIYSADNSALYLSVRTPKGDWIYPMDADVSFTVEGETGPVSIRIEKNEAFVVSSTCSNKTCIAAPKLKNHGDWNACLPNKVFLTVEKK